MRHIDKIIIHCADTPAGRANTVEDIDRWHREQGFNKVGYHYVVHLDGQVHPGRALSEIGAHCSGHNRTSIGICYIGGGCGIDTRTEAQKTALLSLVRCLKSQFPDAKVYGHRDFSDKACPCFDAQAEYSNL